MSLASPPGRLRCTGRRRRPIRIGSWAFTRTWVGEERWCPQQRPQGGKRRQKSASPLPVSLRQPRFPPDTDLLHQNTPEVDPARSKPNRGLGRDAWKGGGQYLQIWHGKIRAALDHHLRLAVLTAEPSGTTHTTPAGAAAGFEGLRDKEAPKTPPPPSPAPARAFPAVVSGGGKGVGEVGGGGGGKP